jgi:ubiquitin carboxyl-terminal hydrolase 4/11
MMHVAPLTRYFLSDRYSADINKHNILGTGGKVANAYSAVLKDLWMGGHQYQNVSPTALKRAIELFAPQFSGASQQDSAELITYLLDALHEDLNRVNNPPYVDMPDVDLGRKLSISGAEVRRRHDLSNSPGENILFDANPIFLIHSFHRLGNCLAFVMIASSMIASMVSTRVNVFARGATR